MQEKSFQILDIDELTKNALAHSPAIQWIPYEKANPGIGHVYLLCPKKKECQLAFLCSRYHFISQVNQNWENSISNDPKELHRWTIRPYRIQENGESDSLIEILDDPIYLKDDELSMFLLTISGMLESYTKQFLSNPIKLYSILRSLINS